MKPALPKVSSPSFADFDRVGVVSVDVAEEVGEAVFAPRYDDQVDVLRHEAMSEDSDPAST